MNVSGTATLNAETVERTVKAVEILTGVENKDAKYDEVFTEDKYDSTPDVEHYNNYTKDGKTINSTSTQQTVQADTITNSETVAVSSTQSGSTPDISNRHAWECQVTKDIIDHLTSVYAKRAAESKSTANPENYASQRYYNPNARHYVGGDMCDAERSMAFYAELSMIMHGKFNHMWMADPILEGRGLGNSNSVSRQFNQPSLNRILAGASLHNRNMITLQLNDLLKRNGVMIPENLRLSFVIDSQYRLKVTGTDDENLLKQIEELLNKNGNSFQLYRHILKSTRTLGGEQISTQVKEDSLRKYQVDWAIRNYTDYTRQELDLVNGKFLTKDGIDIMDLMREGIVKEHGAGYVELFAKPYQRELDWLAKTGPDNIPDLTLTINYENGNLFDIGQPYGYGPGQTDWISELLGGKDPFDKNAWLA